MEKGQCAFDIKGHSIQLRVLKRMAESGVRLPSGLIFIGPRGVGKRSIAVRFAMGCLCDERAFLGCGECPSCRKAVKACHPDMYFVEDAANLTMETARGLIEYVSKAPFYHSSKFVIINEIDKLSETVANSLLKTLEEPPPHTTFIFIAENADRVIPTVLSRFHRLSFGNLESKAVREIAAQLGFDNASTEAAVCLGSVDSQLIEAAKGGQALFRDFAAGKQRVLTRDNISRLSFALEYNIWKTMRKRVYNGRLDANFLSIAEGFLDFLKTMDANLNLELVRLYLYNNLEGAGIW